MVEWWQQLEADIAAVDRALEREQEAAITAGKPWPPQHESRPMRGPQSSPGSDPHADGQPGPDNQTARLDKLLAQTAEAAERFAAEKADRKARAQYAARLERQAHAEPEHTLQAEASYEAEIELLSRRAGHDGTGIQGSDLAGPSSHPPRRHHSSQ